jgi:hypothetical protein
MTKQEALNQIEELKKFIEGEENKNVVTTFPTEDQEWCEINGLRSFKLYKEESHGHGYEGKKTSDHLASLLLSVHQGQWFDENGNKVGGYLYWKPNN